MGHGKRIKKKSKRIPLRKKYKIQRKVKEHERKVKKEAKKNPKRLKKKDIGIPNSFPLKAEFINEIERVKREEEHQLKQRSLQLKLREKVDTSDLGMNNIHDIINDASEKQREYEIAQNNTNTADCKDKSTKKFYKEFVKVVEAADVILEVLDARDPMGSRCYPMEEVVAKSPNKRLVFVLNKADLVPKQSLEPWIRFLRRERPTVLFKSSTQQQKNVSHVKAKWKHINARNVSSVVSQCIGADNLMQLLKNYCRNSGIKTSITVGVVGLPNVGKSSLINSLKRSKSCNVGATPGITRSLQEVALDSKVRLLDCPGLVLPGGDMSDAAAALRNAVRVESLADPVTPVEAILEKTGHEYMMLLYTIPSFKNVNEFLGLIAKKTGKLGKEGVPNIDSAAKKILNDWNSGKIKYYSLPPKDNSNAANSEPEILSQYSREFSLDEFDQEESFESLPDVMDAVSVLPADPVRSVRTAPLQEKSMELDEADQVENENDETPSQTEMIPENILISKRSEKRKVIDEEPEKKSRWETVHKEVDLSKVSLEKLHKTAARKRRKEHNRNIKRTDDLADALSSFKGLNDDSYDFNDYFNKP